MTRDRVDGNQGEIVKGLLDVPGVSVTRTNAVKDGFPDIVVGYRELNFLLEIKSLEGKLTSDEKTWFEGWRGQAAVVRTLDEALKVIGVVCTK